LCGRALPLPPSFFFFSMNLIFCGWLREDFSFSPSPSPPPLFDETPFFFFFLFPLYIRSREKKRMASRTVGDISFFFSLYSPLFSISPPLLLFLLWTGYTAPFFNKTTATVPPPFLPSPPPKSPLFFLFNQRRGGFDYEKKDLSILLVPPPLPPRPFFFFFFFSRTHSGCGGEELGPVTVPTCHSRPHFPWTEEPPPLLPPPLHLTASGASGSWASLNPIPFSFFFGPPSPFFFPDISVSTKIKGPNFLFHHPPTPPPPSLSRTFSFPFSFPARPGRYEGGMGKKPAGLSFYFFPPPLGSRPFSPFPPVLYHKQTKMAPTFPSPPLYVFFFFPPQAISAEWASP